MLTDMSVVVAEAAVSAAAAAGRCQLSAGLRPQSDPRGSGRALARRGVHPAGPAAARSAPVEGVAGLAQPGTGGPARDRRPDVDRHTSSTYPSRVQTPGYPVGFLDTPT